jgi:hypothetical protein
MGTQLSLAAWGHSFLSGGFQSTGKMLCPRAGAAFSQVASNQLGEMLCPRAGGGPVLVFPCRGGRSSVVGWCDSRGSHKWTQQQLLN